MSTAEITKTSAESIELAAYDEKHVPLRSPTSFEHFRDDESEDSTLVGSVKSSDRIKFADPIATRDEDIEAQPAPTKPKNNAKLMTWILINIFATIGIVFINKTIFDDPSFRGAQLSFAAFHFFITFTTLHIVSLPRFGFFERRRAAIRDLLPVAIAMSLNVVLPNLSLAYSSVTFYQTARVMLTPVVAALNYLLYRLSIPRQAAYTLIPVCVGVAMVTYYETQPAPGAPETTDPTSVKGTTPLGVLFATTGVLASSIYTVWVGAFTKKLNITSVQLLHNLAPVGATTLLYFIPFLDDMPDFGTVALPRWIMILGSGMCACLINLSQFIIIGSAGAVSSTVVGHTKTCAIVVLGWLVSGRSVSDYSVIGCAVAAGGIVLYSVATILYKDHK